MPANKPPFDGERVKLGELISKAPIERCGDGKYPVYSMTMRDGIVEQAGRFKKTIASKDTSSYKVVKKNQLVVGFPIDEGVIYVQHHDVPGIMSPAYNVWNINLGRVDPSYLEFALHSPRSMAYYADKMRGTTARRRTLTADGLREMEILLPSVDEQVRVVNTLDEVRSLIKEANGQIAMLDTLVKSRFVEMFGDPAENTMSWDSASLTSLGRCKNGMNFKSKESGIELPCLGVGDFKDRTFINGVSEMGRVNLDTMPSEGYFLKDGDIVFVRSNGNKRLVGRCLAVFPNGEKAVYSGFCIRLRIESDRVRIPYLVWALRHPSMRQQMFGRGANVQNLNQKLMSNVEVPIPPLPEQDCFLDFVAEVDKSRFVVQQKIEKLQMLYNSLAQEYFG